jgi:ParB-like chromosome segregation protein Spo0J
MGDVKLTPRQTAAILDKLDEGLRSVTAARTAVIEAMADRRAEKPARQAGTRKPSARKSR